MNKNKIENAKVFISYAWGTEEYQEKVIKFATRLQAEAGIEIVIDKWSMDVGNDTYAFMEKSVNDKTINFVVLLLNKEYAEKANDRKGGVGTETQIISSEVYSKTDQTKFVPIVFQRDENNDICKPTYLKCLLHFDLTQGNAEAEYIRLVRHLYGEKSYPIPPKGNKPDWVDKTETIAVEFFAPLNMLDNEKNQKARRRIVCTSLDDLTKNVMAITVPNVWDSYGHTQEPQIYLDAIDLTKKYRDAYIDLVEKVAGDDYFEDVFSAFAENYKNEIDNTISQNHVTTVRAFFLHEIFIYTILILWKQIEFAKIRNIMQRTYFQVSIRGKKTVSFKKMFYDNDSSKYIQTAKNTKDGKNYINATTVLWQERINEKYKVTEFAFADTLIFNLDILYSEKIEWYWFPCAYILGDEWEINSEFWRFAHGLISKNEIKRYKPLIGTDDISTIKILLKKIADLKSDPQGNGRYGYSNRFNDAPTITDCIKIEEIGTLN